MTEADVIKAWKEESGLPHDQKHVSEKTPPRFFHDESGQPVGFHRPRTETDGSRRIGMTFTHPEHRKKGHAQRALASFLESEKGPVHAMVRPENKASQATFRSLGFVEKGTDEHGRHRLVWEPKEKKAMSLYDMLPAFDRECAGIAGDMMSKEAMHWSKDVSKDIMNDRKYPVSYLTGELKELGEAIGERNWEHIKEEAGDSAFAAQMIMGQRTGLNVPLLGASRVVDKFYNRVNAFKKVFKDKDIPFSVDYLKGGSNHSKPEKVQAAFELAGHPISHEEAAHLSSKMTKMAEMSAPELMDHFRDRARAEGFDSFFAVAGKGKDGASAFSSPKDHGLTAARNAREAHIEWERRNGIDPNHDRRADKGVLKSAAVDDESRRLERVSERKSSMLPPAKLLADVKKKQIGSVGGFKVVDVDGQKIRNKIDTDFTDGGNPARYGYVPKDELWIERNGKVDRPATIAHELHETKQMAKGLTYDRAHERALKVERSVREKLSYAAPAKKPTLTEKVDQHVYGDDKNWSQFEKDMNGKKFRQAVLGHQASDGKLKAYVQAMGDYKESKKVVGVVPSRTSSKLYKVKDIGNRLACGCKDWQYKHSHGGGDCAHIKELAQGLKEKRSNALVDLARGVSVARTAEKAKKQVQKGNAMKENVMRLHIGAPLIPVKH